MTATLMARRALQPNVSVILGSFNLSLISFSYLLLTSGDLFENFYRGSVKQTAQAQFNHQPILFDIQAPIRSFSHHSIARS